MYITKTQEEVVGDEITQIENIRNQALNMFTNSAKLTYDLFWFKGSHPNEKAKRLGTNVLTVFTESAQTQAFIKSMTPDYVELQVPPQFQVNWNQDGSCEIVDVPPVESTVPTTNEKTN